MEKWDKYKKNKENLKEDNNNKTNINCEKLIYINILKTIDNTEFLE